MNHIMRRYTFSFRAKGTYDVKFKKKLKDITKACSKLVTSSFRNLKTKTDTYGCQ